MKIFSIASSTYLSARYKKRNKMLTPSRVAAILFGCSFLLSFRTLRHERREATRLLIKRSERAVLFRAVACRVKPAIDALPGGKFLLRRKGKPIEPKPLILLEAEGRKGKPREGKGNQTGQKGRKRKEKISAKAHFRDRLEASGARKRGYFASQRVSRRVASSISSGRRAKQMRTYSSPPGPKAVPGATPRPASSTS
jgi:hypothetical protein